MDHPLGDSSSEVSRSLVPIVCRSHNNERGKAGAAAPSRRRSLRKAVAPPPATTTATTAALATGRY
jgi:hypothetical protein